jgi:hypothetical protein
MIFDEAAPPERHFAHIPDFLLWGAANGPQERETPRGAGRCVRLEPAVADGLVRLVPGGPLALTDI